MKVLGASNGLPTGEWNVLAGSIMHWGTTRVIDSSAVANVGYLNTSRGDYNYAAGAVEMFSGAAFFGPPGLIVGGLLPKGFRGQVVELYIEFADGARLRAKGKPEEYERLVKWSMREPGAGFLGRMNVDQAEREAIRGLASDEDRERLRRTLADEKAAKAQRAADQRAKRAALSSPPARAERKARRRAVID